MGGKWKIAIFTKYTLLDGGTSIYLNMQLSPKFNTSLYVAREESLH